MRPVPVHRSVVLTGPARTKVRVTLVSYVPREPEPSGDALAPHVFGVNLSLTNLSSTPVRAHAPDYYVVLTLVNTTGAETVSHASGPCGGSFYDTPIQLPPHRSAQGCIPFRYSDGPNTRPVSFGFGFGIKLTRWPVHI